MTLSHVLNKLIAFSANDHQPHSHTLERGLVVLVVLHPNDKFTLRIARHGRIPPSTLEYQTCVRALPESHKPPTPVDPIAYQENGYHLLSASWKLPEKLL